jgi:flavin-dependent dehydrogenase
MNRLYDAVIIGGGPAGSMAGLLLARAGWSVALVERAPFPRRKVCGEFLSATNLSLLRQVDLAGGFLGAAGPEVRSVAIFAGRHAVIADMPQLLGDRAGWGHALGREQLDTLLLERAEGAGVKVWQPCTAVDIHEAGDVRRCTIVSRNTNETTELHAPIVIAAHGSWDAGHLSTQPPRRRPRASDLFGFKAHFVHTRLPAGLMPLLAFPGGYGGMVHSDHGRVSLSCCIRRDALQQCRRFNAASAGNAVLAHMKHSCSPLTEVLDGAIFESIGWRGAGPIRPGIRSTRRNGIFLLGNAAGEAHPVVAEGIGMAMQSAWMLAQHLAAHPKAPAGDALEAVADGYAADWRRAFSWRIHAASLIAHWAMRPAAVALTLPLLRAFPAVLTEGARTTGKVSPLCSPSS